MFHNSHCCNYLGHATLFVWLSDISISSIGIVDLDFLYLIICKKSNSDNIKKKLNHFHGIVFEEFGTVFPKPI